MNHLSSHNRNHIKSELQQNELDVLVIGGGITGAGIALDAKQRGMNVGLVEMQDFAAGTSSRSTKLVHGGLRYLKQLEVGLVAEVGKERAIVYENGPHITTPEWMMLPFYKGGTFGPFSTNIGLRVYDFLAGVKKSERREMLKPKEALNKEPLLQPKKLKGAGYYVEYKTDDARLTIEVIKKAVELGAHITNYVKAIDFLYNEQGKVCGITAKDELNGETFDIHAKKVINAGGPWVDELRELNHSKKGKTLQLTKGTHLVFSQEVFPLQQAIYFDTHDKRMIFAIPREGKTYVGTTDTMYDAEIAHPEVTKEDRDYLLKAIHEMFPSLNITAESIESSWAGVRPLIGEEGKDPSEISRKDEIFISESGLYSMAGGKLTGYRKMAEQVVDKLVEAFKKEEKLKFDRSTTKDLPLSGGDVGGSKGFQTFKQEKVTQGLKMGLTEESASKLVARYGSNVMKVFELYQANKHVAKAEHIDPIVFAELLYAIENELTYKPVDFFIRRTGAMFFDVAWVEEHQDAVVNYMEKVFGWSQEEKEKYEAEVTEAVKEAKLEVLN